MHWTDKCLIALLNTHADLDLSDCAIETLSEERERSMMLARVCNTDDGRQLG